MRIAAILLLISFSVGLSGTARAEDDPAYKAGSVYNVIFVRTKPDMFSKYMNYLGRDYKRAMDAAIGEGFVLSYKIVHKAPAHPGDWDLMILEEYENWAVFDGIEKKFKAMEAKMTAGEPKEEDGAKYNRNELREILGSVLAREQILY